jgi:hypothetical protein
LETLEERVLHLVILRLIGIHICVAAFWWNLRWKRRFRVRSQGSMTMVKSQKISHDVKREDAVKNF